MKYLKMKRNEQSMFFIMIIFIYNIYLIQVSR